MDMGVGYNGHVYRHVGGTSINTLLIVKWKIKKYYLIVEIFILGGLNLKIYIVSEDGALWTIIIPTMGHHEHVHSAPYHVRCTPYMVPQHDDCYKCSFN